MQVIRSREQFDVCVIGSGAGGGMAAKVLTEAGARRRDARSGHRLGSGQGLQDVHVELRARRGAAPRPPDRPLGEFTAPPTAAGRSRASPTRRRPAATSTGSAAACSAGAPITGAASRCASARTTSSARRSTGSATTGRSPTTTSSRTTTRSTSCIGIFGSNEGFRNEPDGIFMPPPRAALLRAADQEGVASKLEHPVRAGADVDHHEAAQRPRRLPLLRRVRAAAAPCTRTSRRRRCCCRRR